jgi:hypothetical protein
MGLYILLISHFFLPLKLSFIHLRAITGWRDRIPAPGSTFPPSSSASWSSVARDLLVGRPLQNKLSAHIEHRLSPRVFTTRQSARLRERLMWWTEWYWTTEQRHKEWYCCYLTARSSLGKRIFSASNRLIHLFHVATECPFYHVSDRGSVVAWEVWTDRENARAAAHRKRDILCKY